MRKNFFLSFKQWEELRFPKFLFSFIDLEFTLALSLFYVWSLLKAHFSVQGSGVRLGYVTDGIYSGSRSSCLSLIFLPIGMMSLREDSLPWLVMKGLKLYPLLGKSRKERFRTDNTKAWSWIFHYKTFEIINFLPVKTTVTFVDLFYSFPVLIEE